MIDEKKGSFQLYGFDIMMDKRFKPWLIEVNSNPALDYSTKITEKLVPEMLEDMIKVVIDYGHAPES
jgi:tubulin monoglycylase TTLL3/8